MRTRIYRDWRAMLTHGLEAGGLAPEEVEAIEGHGRTGRPWGDIDFIERLEAMTGRLLSKGKPGPKAQAGT